MNCTFYRPKTVNANEFENIVGKLRYDLHLLETEKCDEWSVYTYIFSLSRLAKPLAKNPKMSFLGLDEPEKMPSDARVDFFYRPTYIATAFMIKAVLLYPSLMNEATFLDSDLDFKADTVRSTLSACMLACTGRNFEGAGVLRLSECLKIFEDAGVIEFIEKYPDICPEFNLLFEERKAFLENGGVDDRERWYMRSRGEKYAELE